jgi:hypothetical protein
VYWEDAAKALIEEDAAAQKPLSALLGDKRDAPVWGSEEVREYQEYHYRVCGYAWDLLNRIQWPRDTKRSLATSMNSSAKKCVPPYLKALASTITRARSYTSSAECGGGRGRVN